jgi:DNA-binding NarL/FixJ family response regulator
MQSQKCRILLVDDHAPVRQAMRNLLGTYEDLEIIGEAADGKEAIDIVEACQPDVILMDIRMPRMNGVEASSMIKKSWNEVVIIGLCMIEDRYSINAFMRAGASAVISKDRLQDLRPTIERSCGLSPVE